MTTTISQLLHGSFITAVNLGLETTADQKNYTALTFAVGALVGAHQSGNADLNNMVAEVIHQSLLLLQSNHKQAGRDSYDVSSKAVAVLAMSIASLNNKCVKAEPQTQVPVTTSPTPSAFTSNLDEIFLDDLFKVCQAVIAEQLGVAAREIKRDSHFVADLGADSLDAIELTMAFEDEFDIEIPDEKAEKMHTVGEAFSYVRALIGNGTLGLDKIRKVVNLRKSQRNWLVHFPTRPVEHAPTVMSNLATVEAKPQEKVGVWPKFTLGSIQPDRIQGPVAVDDVKKPCITPVVATKPQGLADAMGLKGTRQQIGLSAGKPTVENGRLYVNIRKHPQGISQPMGKRKVTRLEKVKTQAGELIRVGVGDGTKGWSFLLNDGAPSFLDFIVNGEKGQKVGIEAAVAYWKRHNP